MQTTAKVITAHLFKIMQKDKQIVQYLRLNAVCTKITFLFVNRNLLYRYDTYQCLYIK